MLVNKILNLFYLKSAYNRFEKFSTLKGTDYLFRIDSKILLSDGSRKTDIVLGNNVCIYGKLESQNGGRIFFGDNTRLGVNSIIRSVNSVKIGSFTAISDNVIITDNNNHPIDSSFRKQMKLTPQDSDMRKWKHSDNAPIDIGENVWVGENSRIQKGVVVGDNSIIAANSVVTKNVPSNCIVGGNPAKILRYI